MHKEKLKLYQYPPFENLTPLNQFTWEADPINACFLWFQNLELVQQYSDVAIPYIENSIHNIGDSTHDLRMLFIEQRLLGEIATNYKVKYIVKDIYNDNGEYLPNQNGESNISEVYNNQLTHQWGDKQLMRNSFAAGLQKDWSIRFRRTHGRR